MIQSIAKCNPLPAFGRLYLGLPATEQPTEGRKLPFGDPAITASNLLDSNIDTFVHANKGIGGDDRNIELYGKGTEENGAVNLSIGVRVNNVPMRIQDDLGITPLTARVGSSNIHRLTDHSYLRKLAEAAAKINSQLIEVRQAFLGRSDEESDTIPLHRNAI